MDRITYDDIYEIAAEVAEETITKFLQNLVKLIPSSEDIIDDIKYKQREELKLLKQHQNSSDDYAQDDNYDFGPKSFVEQQNEDFANIAGKRLNESSKLDVDSALSQIPLENSNLFEQAASSDVDNSKIIAQAGVGVI